jgi:hypothetical protein
MATAKFLKALRSSHTVTTRMELWSKGNLIVPDLPVLAGKTDGDSAGTFRRKLTADLVDTSKGRVLTPSSANFVVGPYGAELRPYRGIKYRDGTTEDEPLGVFRISANDVTDAGDGVAIQITSFDRSRAVARRRFITPYWVPMGTSYVQAIVDIIRSRLFGIEFILPAIDDVTPSLIIFQEKDDPWKAVQTLADAIGCEVFFDVIGRLVLRPLPSLNSGDTFEYVEGETATLLDVSTHQDDDLGYNGVVFHGVPQDTPIVTAVVWDDDPDSPTYYKGDYGMVPYFASSPLMWMQEQVNNAALKRFQLVHGITEQVKFTAIPNPAHELNDVVELTRQSLKLDGHYILESISIPLTEDGDMSVVTRKRRSGAIFQDIAES